MLVYLNDVAEKDGGATIFPKLDIQVQPTVGTALYFKNLKSNGRVNPLTLHGGAPIISDGVEKWACNIWIRTNVYERTPRRAE
jgi:prolyl 4-hydroxylase